MDMRHHVRIDIGLESRLGSLQYGFLEGVVLLVEDKRKRHLKAGDADIILEHAALDEVFARSRVAHMPQGVYYLLRIHL